MIIKKPIIKLILVIFFCAVYNLAYALQASWYSVESLKREGTWKNGERRMANGEKFNDNGFTCANRLYPLGAWLCVTNLESGKSVIVRTTDRIGKRFSKTRIDLSKRAFMQIADLRKGIINISVEEIKK